MSKEEDWKELEEWQDKQNEIKQKNNVKEFKAKEYRGTEIFTKLISKLLGSVFSIFVIIFIIAVIVSLFYIKSLFGIYASVNVKKQLKNEYRGQKFVVVNNYGKDIEKDNGQFLMSPKNNKNIIFKVEKGSVYMVDDYSENRLKYYMENCSDKSLVSNLNIEQGIKEGYNTDFLKYEVYIDIENYDELESACNKAYNIVKYLEEQDNKKSQINEDKGSILFQRDMKFEYYQNNESVRELYDFLSNSSSRENTVVEEEKKLLDTFDSIKVELIKSNIKAIKSYNRYAEKSGMYVCPLPEGNETMREHKDTEKIVPVLQNLIEVSDEELKNQLEGNNKTEIDNNEQR